MNLLDFGVTDHAYNSRDTFTNFRPMRKEAYTAMGEQNISYGQEDVMKEFTYSDIIFTNIFYISILVNNLYSISYLCYCRWNINMKHSEEIIFSIDNRVIGYADET